MTRIIGGSAGGRRLSVPPGREIRPTAGRAREAMFGTLSDLTDLAAARFLDLYAGSGAVGLEALSRGAIALVLVEADPVAAQVITDNIAAVGLPGARLVRRRVEQFLHGPPESFEVVFADPPYGRPDEELLGCVTAVAQGWAGPGAVLVVERPTRGEHWTWPTGIEAIKAKRYGEATLWYGRRS
ncbi:MAG: 16S rRNA (guanine(966)-N(2))-methyltransferase RsmD [Pseudonocardiales bacterium]